MTKEAEIGEMCLKAKECQRPDTRRHQSHKMGSPLEPLKGFPGDSEGKNPPAVFNYFLATLHGIAGTWFLKESNLYPLAWKPRVLTTGPPRNPSLFFFDHTMYHEE